MAKVYELLSNPVDFPKFLERIDSVERINSQTFEYKTKIGNDEFVWTTNLIDNLRNTRFVWITINGNLNQTGTIRFTPLDNGVRTRVEFSLDCAKLAHGAASMSSIVSKREYYPPFPNKFKSSRKA